MCSRAPDDAQSLLPLHHRFAAAFDMRQKRPDMLTPRRERRAVEAQMIGIDPAPVEFR